MVTNIHVARSLLECCDCMNCRAAMLKIDLEKTFNRVSHEILFTTLKHMHVGSVLLRGLRMAYIGCTTNSIINEFVCKRITFFLAVRKCCPF